MRPLVLALALAAALPPLRAGAPPAAPAPAPTPAAFVGTWEGTDAKGVHGSFELGADGYATLIMDGQRMGGHVPGGRSMHWVLDLTKRPVWLDFVAEGPDGRELGRLCGLAELTGPGTLRLLLDFGGNPASRPKDFQGASEDSCMTLTRRK